MGLADVRRLAQQRALLATDRVRYRDQAWVPAGSVAELQGIWPATAATAAVPHAVSAVSNATPVDAQAGQDVAASSKPAAPAASSGHTVRPIDPNTRPRRLPVRPRSAPPGRLTWIEATLLGAGILLLLQLFPAVWWALAGALDVRNWGWKHVLAFHAAAIIFVVLARSLPKITKQT